MTAMQQRGRVARVHDIEMRYDDRGDGEPLVLLHGFSGAGEDWAHVFDLAELAGRYRLVVPDLRGHGGSTHTSGPITHRQCARDLLALLDQLGIARFKAIGMSLGGNTLLHAAVSAPDRVEAMVLVAATPYFPEQARKIMREVAVDGRSEDEWRVMRERHTRGDEQIRELWRQMRGLADSYDDMSFTPPHLATVRARTLVVNGDRDPLYPAELSLELYRSIPRASLWIVPDAGHGPIFGAWRETFARAALGWLSSADRPVEAPSRLDS